MAFQDRIDRLRSDRATEDAQHKAAARQEAEESRRLAQLAKSMLPELNEAVEALRRRENDSVAALIGDPLTPTGSVSLFWVCPDGPRMKAPHPNASLRTKFSWMRRSLGGWVVPVDSSSSCQVAIPFSGDLWVRIFDKDRTFDEFLQRGQWLIWAGGGKAGEDRYRVSYQAPSVLESVMDRVAGHLELVRRDRQARHQEARRLRP